MQVYGELTGALNTPQSITGVLNGAASFSVTLTAPQTIQGELATLQRVSGLLAAPGTLQGTIKEASGIAPPQYAGEITITPTAETQMLQTGGYWLADNITINPIPNNYGLITWNGSVLTVS